MKFSLLMILCVGCGGAVDTEETTPEPEPELCAAGDEECSCEVADDCDQTEPATCWRGHCYVLL